MVTKLEEKIQRNLIKPENNTSRVNILGEMAFINEQFESFSRHIGENIHPINDKSLHYADKSPELLKSFCDHRQKYGKLIDASNILTITHPFYAKILTKRDYYQDGGRKLSEEGIKELDEYINKFTEFLKQIKDNSNINVVAFESLYQYPFETSLFLEQGLFDNVILTEQDNGHPQDFLKVLFQLKDKTIFVGGGYNGRCLGSTVKYLNHIYPNNPIYAIRDLCLNAPYDSKSILNPQEIFKEIAIPEHKSFPRTPISKKFSWDQIFTLEELQELLI